MVRASSFTEKRRFKRLELSLPTMLRHDGKKKSQEGVALNVSFNGAYIVDIDVKDIKLQDRLRISISVPKDDARDFPFSRVAGKANVVRLEKDAVALEFSEDISRLFVAN